MAKGKHKRRNHRSQKMYMMRGCNKTNKKEFLDILWCQRYGTDKLDKGPCRGANPLSCSQCVLKTECLSYKKIKDEYIYVSDDLVSLKSNLKKSNLFFGVVTSEGTPRKVYVLQSDKFNERDSHSGLDIPKSISIPNGKIKFDDFVNLV